MLTHGRLEVSRAFNSSSRSTLLAPCECWLLLTVAGVRGSKVVVITSKMGSFGCNTDGGMYGYRMSKAAANMAVKNLSIDLKQRGVAVAAFHPGAVMTEMYFSYHAKRTPAGGGPPPAGALTVDQCVRGLLEQVTVYLLRPPALFCPTMEIIYPGSNWAGTHPSAEDVPRCSFYHVDADLLSSEPFP
eukprot:jgi/Botrbrau1/9721/Bobra.0388s0014.1